MEVINNIEYLTTDELAVQAKCSKQTIKRKIKDGTISPTLKKGRSNLFTKETVKILQEAVKYNNANNTSSGMKNLTVMWFSKYILHITYGALVLILIVLIVCLINKEKIRDIKI